MPFIALDPAVAAPAPVTTLGAPLTSQGMTLMEFRGRLNLQLGGRPDVQPSNLDQWINAAYIDICSSLELEELKGSQPITTVIGQHLYLLPKTVRAIRHASIIDAVTYGELGGRQLSLTDLRSFRRSPDRSDEPQDYFRVGEILVLYPNPAAIRTISLDVWIRPQKLIDDTDSPILAEEWHEPILRNARQMALSDLREWEPAAVAKNDYVSMVRQKSDTDELEEADKIVGSSVPRDRRAIFRRHARLEDDRDGLR